RKIAAGVKPARLVEGQHANGAVRALTERTPLTFQLARRMVLVRGMLCRGAKRQDGKYDAKGSNAHECVHLRWDEDGGRCGSNVAARVGRVGGWVSADRKSTRLKSSHVRNSYA